MKVKKVVCLAKKNHYKITIRCVKISTQICSVCGHTCLQSASCLQWLKFMCGRDSQILALDSINIASFLAPCYGNAPKLGLTLHKMLWIFKKEMNFQPPHITLTHPSYGIQINFGHLVMEW